MEALDSSEKPNELFPYSELGVPDMPNTCKIPDTSFALKVGKW